jgi:alkylation response protein AidB-like acyl-CoA dehydrogenase
VAGVPSDLVESVTRVIDDVIAPAALRVDAEAVPRSHLDALAPTGIFGASVDPAVPAADRRRAQEVLAGGCLATWFVQAQHHTPLRLVHDGPPEARERLEPLLASGTTIAGVAFSHLRRWPDRPVRAARVPGGWQLAGTAPWYTGWGVNDVAVVGAASDRGEVVFALVPAEASPFLRPGPPVQTAALTGARTVPLELRDLVVGDDGVLAVEPLEQWRRHDEAKTANLGPGVVGAAEATLRLLATSRDDAAREAAARLAGRLAAVRQEAYALADEADPFEHLERRLQLRAAGIELCLQASAAAVVAGGGRAMLGTDPAQLYARWALFLSVQAQTAPLRRELLARLTG